MTHVESSVFRAIAESISICSKKRGWALHIVTAADAINAKSITESWHADGCIVYASSPSGLNLKNINMNVPTVHISPVWECKSKLTVSHDSCITGCVAAHELGDLGLDNFAFAANHSMPPWAEKRLSTYRSELVRRGRTANVYDGGDLRAWLRSLQEPISGPSDSLRSGNPTTHLLATFAARKPLTSFVREHDRFVTGAFRLIRISPLS